MSLTSIRSLFRRVPSPYSSLLLYAFTWTLLLIVTVVMVTLAPLLAFKLAISQPPSCFSNQCGHGGGGFIRIPLDFPREMMVYLPEQVVMIRSHFDFFLPTLFAALAVGASACLLHAVTSEVDFDNS